MLKWVCAKPSVTPSARRAASVARSPLGRPHFASLGEDAFAATANFFCPHVYFCEDEGKRQRLLQRVIQAGAGAHIDTVRRAEDIFLHI